MISNICCFQFLKYEVKLHVLKLMRSFWVLDHRSRMKTSLWTLGRCAEHFLYFFDSMILKMADIDTVFAVIPQTHVINIWWIFLQIINKHYCLKWHECTETANFTGSVMVLNHPACFPAVCSGKVKHLNQHLSVVCQYKISQLIYWFGSNQ